MRDENKGLVFGQFGKAGAQQAFCGLVHIACGLVEDEHFGVVQKGAGQGNGLPLPAGNGKSLLAHGRAQAAGQCADKVRGSGLIRGPQHPLIFDAGIVQRDVVAYGAVEKGYVLGQVAYAAPQVDGVHLPQVNAAKAHGPVLGRVEPGHEPADGGLARTHAADDGHLFVGPYGKAHVGQRIVLCPRIAETHVFKREGGLQQAKVRLVGLGRVLGGQFHDGVQRGEGHARLVQARDHARQLHERSHGPARQNVAGNEAAHGHRVVHDAVHAPDDDPHGHKLAEPAGHAEGQGGVAAGHARCLCRGVTDLFPQVEQAAFGPAGFDGFKPVHDFNQQGVFLHVQQVVGGGMTPRAHLQQKAQAHHKGHGRQGHAHNGAADKKYEAEKDDKKGQVGQNNQTAGTEKIP